MTTTVPARVKLIEAVQAKCRAWDAMAQQDALECVRHPGDKERAERARVSVTCADRSAMLERDIVNLINGAWPTAE